MSTGLVYAQLISWRRGNIAPRAAPWPFARCTSFSAIALSSAFTSVGAVLFAFVWYLILALYKPQKNHVQSSECTGTM